MTEQRITVTHLKGIPLADQAIYFDVVGGGRYRLTHYETIDAKVVWLHGYREAPAMEGIGESTRFYTSRTTDEVENYSLKGLMP